MEDNLQNRGQPVEGTPEYDQYMREHFGEDYELGFRVGFGRRLGAYLLDFLFTGILGIVVQLLSGTLAKIQALGPDLLNNMDKFEAAFTEAIPLTSIITLAYFSTDAFFAATPGKMILSIKIANEDRTEAEFGNLFNRFALKNFQTLFSLIAVIGGLAFFETLNVIYFFILIIGFFFTLGIKRQAFHDMLTRTAVYYNENIKNQQEN